MRKEDLKPRMYVKIRSGEKYFLDHGGELVLSRILNDIDAGDKISLDEYTDNLIHLSGNKKLDIVSVMTTTSHNPYVDLIWKREDEWKDFIRKDYFNDNAIYDFTLTVLNEFDFSEFKKAPGGAVHHHNYEGGLKEHTNSVAEYCNLITSKIPYINKSVLISAAYLHDMGKMFDYRINEETKEIEVTTECRLVYHICSVLPFIEKHSSLISKNDFLHIKHCILSHHGKHEWRSPVTPQTPEAYILHTADMLSSRLDDYKPDDNREWQLQLKTFGPIWNPNYKR